MNQNPRTDNDKSITWKDREPPANLSEAFRILPRPEDQCASIYEPDDDMEIEEPNIFDTSIYLAARTKRTTNGTLIGACGVLYLSKKERNTVLKSSKAPDTTSITLLALKRTLEYTNNYENINIHTSSKQIFEALTEKIKSWEDKGWLGAPNKILIKKIITRLRNRKGRTVFSWVDKGVEQGYIAEAKELAEMALASSNHEETLEDPLTPEAYSPIGARLAGLSQAEIHSLIRENEKPKESKTSKLNIAKITLELKRKYKQTTPAGKIWTALKKAKRINKKHREFIYKTIKATYYLGKKWAHCTDEELSSRETCRECQVEDSMEHILTECSTPERKAIWEAAGKIWTAKGGTWQAPKIGEIMGINSVIIKNRNNKPDEGKTRLYHILITECAHLIWKLRCEKVINGDTPNHQEPATRRALKQLELKMNHKIRMDIILTDTKRFSKKALDKKTASDTWEGILENEYNFNNPPENIPGFLVGRHFF
ncbi:hypothetical protein AGABI2DRAFT_117576 [Agaricus bisporus var. bisporus H97]|uniref:hypothetical protein n=1 Tax=Agaricus bisporus var. bisporus (strain H97 / ATCC MYA-4626 / FGSC 10389) TaxID=936046 RepID=UPI00029F79E6|nr:hypothetical protein AGABI2DRAFT_117576 [Agaricus bisporus var. bisporus H97]EKV46990.1 hypothetical protein AGABI2DRAFT_117576 [Agaricus bisporus var. bisporus H97]